METIRIICAKCDNHVRKRVREPEDRNGVGSRPRELEVCGMGGHVQSMEVL